MSAMTKWISISALTFVMAGCTALPMVPFEGSKIADQQLSQDVYQRVSFHTEALGCDEVQKIKTEVTVYPHGEPGERRAEERWDVFGCEKRYPYQITFREDGRGGTYFSINVPNEGEPI